MAKYRWQKKRHLERIYGLGFANIDKDMKVKIILCNQMPYKPKTGDTFYVEENDRVYMAIPSEHKGKFYTLDLGSRLEFSEKMGWA